MQRQMGCGMIGERGVGVEEDGSVFQLHMSTYEGGLISLWLYEEENKPRD
jgi:hypothetical protein